MDHRLHSFLNEGLALEEKRFSNLWMEHVRLRNDIGVVTQTGKAPMDIFKHV